MLINRAHVSNSGQNRAEKNSSDNFYCNLFTADLSWFVAKSGRFVSAEVTHLKQKMAEEPTAEDAPKTAPVDGSRFRLPYAGRLSETVSISTENLLNNLQGYIKKQNTLILRRLSYHSASASADFDAFKNWIYQDLDKHRDQLREAGSSLFFRQGDKSNFDIVIILNQECESGLSEHLKQLLQLFHPALCVEPRKHYFSDSTENALYITASDAFFEQLMKQSLMKNSEDFEGDSRYYPHTAMFSSLQRQSILIRLLLDLKYQCNQEGVAQLDSLIKYLDQNDPIIEKLIESTVIDQIFPLHQEEDLGQLKTSWVTKFFDSQPLDKICSYFGIKIAIYFAFIGFYTNSLLYPAFFGLLIPYLLDIATCCNSFITDLFPYFKGWLEMPEPDVANDIFLFIFTIFNIFWSTFMLQKWELNCRKLASKWSNLLPTDLFEAYNFNNQKSSESEGSRRNIGQILFKYFVTFPIIGVSLAVTFKIMFNIFNLQVRN